MESAQASLVGAVLDGRYRVLEAVAEGAMGVVYRAERVKLGRVVAIKILHDELPSELSSRKRFEIEAMAMAKLEHPHCAAVLDVGVHEEKPFVVMDFVSGQNLKELIAKGPVPIPRAVEIVRQTLSGLAHAHEHDIIHRDIKPANIVLSQKAGLGDHVKILDFGLARFNQEASNLTTGIVVGTPSYMAPEQIRGVQLDRRADLYAVGVLLFELLTGKKPFYSKKDDPVEVCAMHLKNPPPALAATLPGTDFGELEAVVAKSLAKKPDDRYATAEEMAGALAAAIGRHGALLTPAVGVPVQAQSVAMPAEPSVAGAPAPSAPPAPAVSAPPAPAPPAPAPPAPAASAPQPTHVPVAPAASPPSHVPVVAPQEPRPFPFTHKQLAIGGGGLLLVIVVIAVIAGGGNGAKQPTAATPGDAAARSVDPVASDPGDPVGDVLSRANELVANGRREAALDLLSGARRTYPDDARLAFLAGKLYFAKLWWNDGLKHLRDAVRLDPAFKTDPELIKTVLRGFITTPRYDGALGGFLRDHIGEPAKPYLEETASTHPNPGIRARARSLLERY